MMSCPRLLPHAGSLPDDNSVGVRETDEEIAEQVDEILTSSDSDNDGYIDYAEFIMSLEQDDVPVPSEDDDPRVSL